MVGLAAGDRGSCRGSGLCLIVRTGPPTGSRVAHSAPRGPLPGRRARARVGTCSSRRSAPPPAPVARSCCARTPGRRRRRSGAGARGRAGAPLAQRAAACRSRPSTPGAGWPAGPRPGAGHRRRVDLDGRPGRRPRRASSGCGRAETARSRSASCWPPGVGRGAVSAALREAARWAFLPVAEGGAGARGAALGGADRQLGLAPGRVDVRVPGRGPGARAAPPPRRAPGRLDRVAAPRRPAARGRPWFEVPELEVGDLLLRANAPDDAERISAGLLAPDHRAVAARPARPVHAGRGPRVPGLGGGGARRRRARCTGRSPTPTTPTGWSARSRSAASATGCRRPARSATGCTPTPGAVASRPGRCAPSAGTACSSWTRAASACDGCCCGPPRATPRRAPWPGRSASPRWAATATATGGGREADHLRFDLLAEEMDAAWAHPSSLR